MQDDLTRLVGLDGFQVRAVHEHGDQLVPTLRARLARGQGPARCARARPSARRAADLPSLAQAPLRMPGVRAHVHRGGRLSLGSRLGRRGG